MHRTTKLGLIFFVIIVVASCTTRPTLESPAISSDIDQPLPTVADPVLATARIIESTPTPVRDIQNYHLLLAAEPIIPGVVSQLFVTDDRAIWLASDSGLARIDADHEQVSIVRFWDIVIGNDQQGRVWVISENGSQISAWDGVSWAHYRDGAGWVPIANMDQCEAADFMLLQDVEGRLWLKTKTDIRSFTNNKWYVFTLAGMGFSDRIKKAIDYRLALAISDFDKSVWAGMCYFNKGIPGGGQGVRIYNNHQWTSANEVPDDACVSAIAGTSSGAIIAIQDQIIRYDLISRQVTIDKTPDLAEPTNLKFGYVADLAVGPDNVIWPFYSLCGDAGCDLFFVHYRLALGKWQLIDDLSIMESQKVLFSQGGDVILIGQNQVRLVDDISSTIISEIRVIDVYQNSQKEIWLLAEFNQKLAVWKLVSPVD